MIHLQVDPLRPDPAHVAEAARVMRGGGIVAFPTDTLYGLTCDPRNRPALQALRRLKGRPPSLRFPFIAADLAQAGALVSLEGDLVPVLTGRFWPGPLSLVLPLARPDRLASWNWGGTLAIRVPSAWVARALAREVGVPIPATSANRSGEDPLSDPAGLFPALSRGIDLLLDAGPLPESLPSTLLDVTVSPPRLLRTGAVTRESLESVPGMPPLGPGGASASAGPGQGPRSHPRASA